MPAKSGKDENSIEYDTNPSMGTPASLGAAADTLILRVELTVLAGRRAAPTTTGSRDRPIRADMVATREEEK